MEYLAKKSFSFLQDFAFTSINIEIHTNKWNILPKSRFLFCKIVHLLVLILKHILINGIFCKKVFFLQDFAFTNVLQKSRFPFCKILHLLVLTVKHVLINGISCKKVVSFIAWEPRRPVTLFNYVQYIHFSTCHPPGVKRGFIKGEALRLLRTNSSKTLFEESVTNFKGYLLESQDTQKTLFKQPSQKLLLKTGIKPSNKIKNKKRKSCPL